jgi:uncharacterized membrane protein
MKLKLINFWESLRLSFWFIPTLMVLTAISMSFLIVRVDRVLQTDAIRFLGFLYSGSPEGARSVLSTIASSMMTVTGVTFSITIVVLNLASSQFGPRLLRNFMQDRSIQFVLGIFVASFIYCLLVLRSVRTIGTDIFVPNFAVSLAVVLALLDVGVLIYFIHHIATSIQADEVIAETSRELEANIKRIFTEELKSTTKVNKKEEQNRQQVNEVHHYIHHLTSRHNGYLQAVDYDKLLQVAKNNDFLIHLKLRPGQFVVAGSRLLTISSKKIFNIDLSECIIDAFIFGNLRTPEQDAEYSIHQLVEVAIRALSPGVNDPYTAIACVDQLGSALCYLAKRKFPPLYRFDEQDKPRLQMKPLTYSGMLNAAFDQIRQYGRTSIAVTIRLLETLTLIAEQTRHPDQRRAIHRQANMILRASQETLFERNDREDTQKRYQLLLRALNEFEDEDGSYEISSVMRG